MDAKRATAQGLVGMVSLGLLLASWAAQALSGGLILAGLGLLALLSYLADRAGHGELLAPGGLLFGLGAGLTVADMAPASPYTWPGVGIVLGISLLAIYLFEHPHTWALVFGGLLLLGAVGSLLVTYLDLVWLVGAMAAVIAGAVVASLMLRRPVAVAALEMIDTGDH